jgi:hypothetical protein
MDAHWVNGRPGHRCRHGHSNARPGSPDRPRNLYVREDVLLAELVGRLIVDGDEPAPSASDMAACLRSRAMVVVHDRTGWSLVARDEL